MVLKEMWKIIIFGIKWIRCYQKICNGNLDQNVLKKCIKYVLNCIKISLKKSVY